jgi:hypothetical protein
VLLALVIAGGPLTFNVTAGVEEIGVVEFWHPDVGVAVAVIENAPVGVEALVVIVKVEVV